MARTPCITSNTKGHTMSRTGKPPVNATMDEAIESALDDELRFLREASEDETVSAEMRADFASRIPETERLRETVMADTTAWKYPLEWHEALYALALAHGEDAWEAAYKALSLSDYDEATARQRANDARAEVRRLQGK